MTTMAGVDRHGLPPAGSTHAATHQEVTRARLTVDLHMIAAQPQSLTGDRGYRRNQCDTSIRAQGTETIAPHRSNRKRTSQRGTGVERDVTA
jgi:hypothetical protein